MTNLQLLVIDDHPLFLKGLQSYLQRDQCIAEVFTADNYESISQICEKQKIDIILMDIHLGELNGIQLTKKIKQQYPSIKVIGLSANDNEADIREMMEAKASGYILKDVDLAELKVAFQFCRLRER